MKKDELRTQHLILGILRNQEQYLHRYLDSTPEEKASGESTIRRAPFRSKTQQDIATELNLSDEKTLVLLTNMKMIRLIGFNYKNKVVNIMDEGYLVYQEQRLLREADNLDELEHKERLAKRISIANVLIPILAFLLPLLWTYFFQIEPLQKERNKLQQTVKQLKLENQQLKIAKE